MLKDPPRYPALFQINTRVRLTLLSRHLGRTATLDDIPDGEFHRLAEMGFDWIWLLGVWQTGPAARKVSLSTPQWLEEYKRVLPDFSEDDVTGSCFAVHDYRVHDDFGGNEALIRLRERLREFGLRLMLDFVPNHMAPDHAWVTGHPEYFVAGDEEKLAREPRNYTRSGDRILAYGRDPYFDGWPDTLQLDYSNPAAQEAMSEQLQHIAAMCDGVRCDMAMLLLPDVFERTWGRRSKPFWSDAINRVRQEHPHFLFMAEVYWDFEWRLQQEGFDYCYDKRLYDRLRDSHARATREHLMAGMSFQNRLARFLENHDEPRAAATFTPAMHQAAAVIAFAAPGLRFFHMGQLAGKRTRIPVHLRRGPDEGIDVELRSFYERLMSVLRHESVRNGEWTLLSCEPAWSGNPTWDNFIAFSWSDGQSEDSGERLLAAVNYAPHPGQCYVRIPFDGLAPYEWRLRDLLRNHEYQRSGPGLEESGLYLDMPAWGYHVFKVLRAE